MQVSAAVLVVALGERVQAQAVTRNDLCINSFNALQPAFSNIERPLSDAARQNGCRSVAAVVQSTLIAARRWAFNTQREENQRKQLEATQTTRGETAPVAGEGSGTIEPVEAAGGSVGAVGSEGGGSAVTTLTLNPAMLMLSPGDKDAIAKWSRFTDFSILVPASDTDKDGDGDVDYIGVRWRINITGLSAGSALVRAVEGSFRAMLDRSAVEAFAIDTMLQRLDENEVKPCIESLLRAGQLGKSPQELGTLFEAAASTCGETPFLFQESTALYTQLDDDIQKARAEADSRYFGLDLRGDFGDLKRFGLDSIAGRSVTLSVGYGRRFPFLQSDASNGIRLNLGARFFEPNAAGDSRIAATGGLAYEVNRYYQHQRLSLVGGLEFEAGTKDDDGSSESQDFLAFRTALNVPLAGVTSVTLSFSTPVAGARKLGPTLSVKANWRLLWTR